MKLNTVLYELFEKKGRKTTVEHMAMGPGYTAVTTSDGGIGLSYTCYEKKTGCTLNKDYRDPEGRPAVELLEKIHSPDPIQRTMALAVINALNYDLAVNLPEEPGNNSLFEKLDIGTGARVLMVGLFRPLISPLQERGAVVEIIDINNNLGSAELLAEKLKGWAQVMLLTSTSLLNNTAEEILENSGAGVRTVLLGPSTPLVKEAFLNLPVHFLAGTVPVNFENTLKAVRHGAGTPVIQRSGRKVLMDIG